MATATDINISGSYPTLEPDQGEGNNFGAEAVTLGVATLEEIDPTGGVVGPTTYFKMRALADPGPGYESWVVLNTPDFAGTFAPGPIFGGTVIVADTWMV